MGKFFHLCVIVCLCLTRRIVHAEETSATSKCQLNANGVVGPDCNLNATTTTTTSSASPLPKSASGNGTENGRARAMNYTLSFQDAMRSNGLKVPGMDFKEHSIDDVSMDEMNDDSNLNYTSVMSNFHNMMNVLPMVKNTTASTCTDNNKTYKIGEKFNKGCNETCQCVKPNEIMCGTICKPPYQVKGRNKDPSCIEVPVDGNSCCVLLNCPAIQDLEAEPIESCYHKNETYKRGSTFNDTCDVCICEAGGRVNCKSRCPRLQNATGNCLAVQDPEDPCCKRILCDVEEHDVNKVGITASDETGISSSTTDNQIISAKALNGTSVSLTFAEKSKDCNVEVSENGVDWNNMECVENTIGGLEPGKKYQFRLKNTASNKVEVTLPRSPSLTNSSMTCSFKGKTYNIGEEFHDGCDAYCICETTGVDCARIECPTDFGLDVLDPQCVSWEMHPPDFTPTPPYCCPDKIRCKDNGSCMYNGENYPNWSELPVKATGCENRCYCEMGKVSCSPMCAKISDTPPKDLLCPPEQAVLQKPPDDECCLHWTCPHVGRPDEVKIHVLEAVDESTVKLVFSVPQVLVGLHGRVELRYTSDQQNNEPSTWEHQILAPPDDLIATAELEFELTGLQPNTTYKIKISVVMSDVGNAPTSNILSIRTPASAPLATTLPPIIPVEPELRAIEVNATYVKVGWRMFSDTELQFIDGVQLRYKELDDKVYAATPLIHRAVTTYTIEQLKPNSIYEIGIFFIPFPGQTTELQAQKTIQIRTGLEFDPYKFDIMVEVHHIKASSIEITWSGVPYPEDKYVNIFRAIYQSDGSREDFSTFKVAKRDSSQNILIQDLKPGTRYRLWLEAYLTNGRTKKSNVKDFITKIGPALPPSTSQGKLEGTPLVEANTYYGPLVAVSILATIAITSTIILILILAKKHGTIKAPITTPINRKNNTSAAYDNQAYKTYENDRNGAKAGSIALTVFPKTHVEKEA